MRIQAIILSTAPALLGLSALEAHAQNFERGQELFEHQCRECHGDPNLSHNEYKAKSLAEVRKKITSWAEHSGTEWGSNEIDDVLLYMNRSFYHFKADQF